MGAESTDVEGECRLVDEEDGKKSNRVSLASCLKEPNAGFVYFYKPCIIVGIVTRKAFFYPSGSRNLYFAAK